MTKTKSNAANVAKLGFWERNKRSNGYLLKKKAKAFTIRSEEHTSELQSRVDRV